MCLEQQINVSYEIYGAKLGERKNEEELLRFFSVQEFVCHMQDISEHHEKVTNFGSYHCDIETETTFPSLKHNSEAVIGVIDL